MPKTKKPQRKPSPEVFITKIRCSCGLIESFEKQIFKHEDLWRCNHCGQEISLNIYPGD